MSRVNLHEVMKATVPDGASGDVQIRRFEVSPTHSVLSMISSSGRGGVAPGTYVGLYRGGLMWMSDTPRERADAIGFLRKAMVMDARRVLVNGLGLGIVVAALLHLDTVEHIDVVEIDLDVIALVGPHYQQLAQAAGKSLAIRHGDAYTVGWPKGTRWDVAWHDIWLELCTDNLGLYATLHRRYGGRVQWQDSWGLALLREKRRRDKTRRAQGYRVY